MKKHYLIALGLLFLFSCKKDAINSPETEKPIDTLQGTINADLILDANTNYILKGQVIVNNNSTLTIPAGTTIAATKVNVAASKSALIITRGSKLNINGTLDQPVVFTSDASVKTAGDWIGIIVLGKAPTNGPGGMLNVKGLPASADTQFGGSTEDDSSGSISYLRLEYCGGLNPDKEDDWELDMASGLSLAGVGSGTKVEHVMVRFSNDDSFQFVGGTVNAKYLIGYNSGDDDFDFDRGFTGKLQFIVSYRTEPSTHAIKANGMESLNDQSAADGLVPYTRPAISNMTIIGPQANTAETDQSQGIYIRRNTRFSVRNSIISEYTDGGLMMCPKTKPLLINNLGSEFKYNLVHADVKENAFTYDDGPTGTNIYADKEVAAIAVISDDNLITRKAVNKNLIIDASADLKFKSLFGESPDLSLADDSPALTGANFTDNTTSTDFTSSFFSVVEYRGAISKDNWAAQSNWAIWK